MTNAFAYWGFKIRNLEEDILRTIARAARPMLIEDIAVECRVSVERAGKTIQPLGVGPYPLITTATVIGSSRSAMGLELTTCGWDYVGDAFQIVAPIALPAEDPTPRSVPALVLSMCRPTPPSSDFAFMDEVNPDTGLERAYKVVGRDGA